MHLVDALRALASTIIAWHHFALYGPLSDYALPVAGDAVRLLANYGRATQIFFVVGGYVMARSMTGRTWGVTQVGRYIIHRYCRLGLPYLAAVVLGIGACAFGRGWLPSEVVDPPPTWNVILAHVFFLQKILGYESFSAGLWFVCVNFQLSLVFVAMLYVRDRLSGFLPLARSEASTVVLMALGWPLAVSSLFYFNIGDRWDNWFIYFFPHFFLGVMVYYGLKGNWGQIVFGLYVLLIAAALVFDFRWRLQNTLIAGLILFFGGKLGLMNTWPKSPLIGYLGRTAYSLFLVHFPVFVVVATVWVMLGWTSPWAAVAGLVFAYIASLAASFVFYRLVEVPAGRLSRKFN
jgi:peptidoglycan/LPS O-acetylase OafA/YrhL